MASNYRLPKRVPPNPPPVPKKPSVQERQRRYEQRVAMEGQQVPMPPAQAPPPPIGYNDADRFYVTSPPPSENSLELDPELELLPQKLGNRTEPQQSTWLSKKLNKVDRHLKGPNRVPANAQTDTKDLTNDEENSRRRLEEQLGDLKAENRAKTRELKTNKYIENEMNRKLKTADDAYLLRHTVKDKDRVIANQDKLIADLTAENAKLAEDLAERDRHVFQLQSEVDNLDRVILAKKALREAERLQGMSEDLDKTRDELANANFEIETAKNELKNMQSTVNRKDRELKSKSDQIEQLTKQLALAETKIAGLENEKSVAENHCKAANREAKILKEQKDKLVEVKERCHNLEEENAYMSDAIRNLEAKVLQLESVKHDKEVLDDLVQDLKSALKDKNHIAKERRNLMVEVQQLRELLREKTVDEEALQKELEKLKDVLNELEKENNFYRDLEVDFRRVKQKYEEVEKERFKNELVLAKLRPRVERLQNRCKEKDDLIRRLANELRAGGDRFPRDLLQESDRNQSNAVNDYIDMADYLDEPLSAHVRRSRERRPYNSAMAAYEPSRGMRQLSPSPTRPYEHSRGPPRVQDGRGFAQEQNFPSREEPENETVARVQQQPTRTEPQMENRAATNKYGQQPTRPDQPAARVPPPTAWDIPNQRPEGASAKINPDAGTSDAVYEERILPTRREDEHRRRQGGYDPMRLVDMDEREEPVRQNARKTDQASVAPRQEQLMQPHEGAEAQHPDQRLRRDTDGAQKPDLVRTNTYPVLDQPEKAAGNPAANEQQRQQEVHGLQPPSNVRARMQPESDSLQVEWDPPVLDELDRNNGIVVSGYKVFINGQEQQQVVSSRVTRSTVPRSALGSTDVSALRISVQSYSHDGETSDKANLSLAPGELPGADEAQRRASPLTIQVDGPTQAERDGGAKSRERQPEDRFRTRDNSPGEGAARLGPPPPPPHPFARKALYDYQPSEHSPSAFPPYELDLRKGDDVQTFGPVRPDGMYNAEVNGKRGLVPAQYLQLD